MSMIQVLLQQLLSIILSLTWQIFFCFLLSKQPRFSTFHLTKLVGVLGWCVGASEVELKDLRCNFANAIDFIQGCLFLLFRNHHEKRVSADWK